MSSFSSYYKLNHGFIKEKPSDMSSIDRKLRNMLEKLRAERRQEFLKFQRAEDDQNFKIKGKNKNKGKNSKFIKNWKLSRTWSRELIEYAWLSKLSEGYKSMQENPQNWLVLPIYRGRRSMLIQGNGYCELRNQDGWRMFTVKNAPFIHTGLTIIDGIYNHDQNTFQCNDLIVWNNLNICTSTTECRLHFLSCRIEESGVTNKTVESIDVSMMSGSDPKFIPNIRIQLGQYLPLSKNNLLRLFRIGDQFSSPQSDFNYLVFVRKDSMYDTEQEFDKLYSQCQEYRTLSQQNWLIWSGQVIKAFKDYNKKEEEPNGLTFRLNINEKNELYTKDKVLIGEVNHPEILNKSLSLDNDQKILMNEYGLVFVKVKFEKENILNLLDLIASRYPFDIFSNNHNEFKSIMFELSNVSSQDKYSSSLDNFDYIFFKCIEFVTETKYKNCTLLDELNLNLNMESLLKSIS
ncbi:uncharacterized protein cubi_00998 [Cryptosporidium ubiquitum]|uniref:Snurportin-1 n=1 Tax=Cryptosporidium ubiquitum TaxID=857276 RepID=A0A1J4MDB4_9CRYT|nr:uncharacterized protein cubi_00998 [Cryptosporidium ubiquitum]OII70853.1 hypothetical protein cubi_00998 [Cryptosporidium ubiquitum]